MPPHNYPSVDESFDRQYRAGWSVGETSGAPIRVVIGTNGETHFSYRRGMVIGIGGS